ncbi:hypothetical protein [Phytohabitans kaempferiae]|uniref:Uncharacterized protein n=1 Tax=Phytohabitans kaempferiae TaxID=1620943 RepID=A0ABV6MBS9_9ACTN
MLGEYRQVEQAPFGPKERQVHRLLGLLGRGPAAQYADAIRILRGVSPLETSSHVVAHMAREIESAVRKILAELIPRAEWAKLEATKKQGQRDPSMSLVVDAIWSALGLDGGDPVREMWKSGRWHKAAHRRGLLPPRPADNELVDRWNNLGAVLWKVLGGYEAMFVRALPAIDELAVADPVTKDHVSRLMNQVPNSVPALSRFFERATPAWFEPLREAGYFASPQRLQADPDGAISYQPWPPGRYLTRIARDRSRSQAVIDVVLALDTDNPEAAETVADVALAVPAAMAARLAFKIALLLRSSVQWRLPSKAVKLLPVLVAGGQSEAAAALLAALLPAPTRRGRRSGHLPRDVVTHLFPELGMPGVAAIAGRLAEQPENPLDDLAQSEVWWPVIDSSDVLDARDQLVTTLRDAALSVAADSGAADVVRVLKAHPDSVFHRLALHVLLRFPEPTLVATALVDAEAFHDIERFVEYGELLRAHFAELSRADQNLLLDFVDQGPQHTNDPAAVERWRHRQFARFGDALPQRYQAERAALVKNLGEPGATFNRAGTGERSDLLALSSAPLPALDTMSDDDLIAYLAAWVPTGKWEDPNIDDAQREIAAAAERDPRRFAALAPRFITLDTVYAASLFAGLRQAIAVPAEPDGDATPRFDWQPVLEFGASVMSEPRRLPDRPGYRDSHRDTFWAWARRNLAGLLAVGVQRELPEALLDQALELIIQLFHEPDPIIRDDGSGEDSHPASDVRHEAFGALLRYAVRRHDPAAPALPQAVRQVLDQHLDPDVDPSPSIRAFYGGNVNLLARLDASWTHQRIRQIFIHTTEPGIASAAWNAYLRSSGPAEVTAHLLRALYEQHLTTVTESQEVNTDPDRPEDRLIQHLAILYQHGAMPLDSAPFATFLDHAALPMRARLIEVIGEQLPMHQRIERAQAGRLQALWTRQFDIARRAGGDLAEIAGFGLWFSSGALPDEWALRQLNYALAAGATLTSCYDIAVRLAALPPECLPQAVAAMALLIDAPDEPWFITGATDEIAAVLQNGLHSANPSTQQLASHTASRLVARGHASFTEL